MKLWHIGNQALDGVSYGQDDKVFKYPACDLGGLTNVMQMLGDNPPFEKQTYSSTKGNILNPLPSMLFDAWMQLINKELPATFKVDLGKWVKSVTDEFKGEEVKFAFFRQPHQHRVIATSSDVIQKTGGYYVRVFGGDAFARESDGKGVFCCVNETSIVPNYNEFNIRYESSTYADGAPL